MSDIGRGTILGVCVYNGVGEWKRRRRVVTPWVVVVSSHHPTERCCCCVWAGIKYLLLLLLCFSSSFLFFIRTNEDWDDTTIIVIATTNGWQRERKDINIFFFGNGWRRLPFYLDVLFTWVIYSLSRRGCTTLVISSFSILFLAVGFYLVMTG